LIGGKKAKRTSLIIFYVNENTEKPYRIKRINYSLKNKKIELQRYAKKEICNLAKVLVTIPPNHKPKKWLKNVTIHVANLVGNNKSSVKYMHSLHALDDVGAFSLKLRALLINEDTGVVTSETNVQLIPLKKPSLSTIQQMADPYEVLVN
jgi:hypothetical protein